MARMPDGILLVPSRDFVFHSDQDYLAGFQQSPNFFYFTGLPSAAGAVLAIDGAAKETWLFVPAKLPGIAGILKMLFVEPGDASANRLGLDHVVDRKQLQSFLVRREEAKPGLVLYAPGAKEGHAFPLDIALDDPAAAWNHALGEIWTPANIRDASPILSAMRLVKSPPRSRSCAASASRAPRPSTPA
jgi:Xaa-Pro aminopeptidase